MNVLIVPICAVAAAFFAGLETGLLSADHSLPLPGWGA